MVFLVTIIAICRVSSLLLFPTFSYFLAFLLLFPTLKKNSYFFLLFEIFRKIYLLIYVFLGLGGISGDSMVPMLHTAVLPLGVN